MSFLAPLFFVGALSAAVPVVLHLLKRHPDMHLRFAAVRFLQQAPVEHSRQRHLRELLLLALRVTALVLLATAFARPFFSASAATADGDAVVVAVDTSLSMSAQGQFEKARTLARQALEAGGAVGVVSFADQASVASRLSEDRAAALAAIDQLEPGLGGTRFRAAVAAGTEMLRGRSGRLIIVTDLQSRGWDLDDRISVPAAVRVEVLDVGAAPANLAITGTRVSGGRLAVTMVNTGDTAVDTVLEATAFAGVGATSPSAPPAATSVTLAPGQSTEATLPAPAGRWATVRVQDRTGITADNERHVVIEQAARPRILVVTATGDLEHDALYAARALAVQDRSAPAILVEGVSGAALAAWDQARVDASAAIILLSTRGLEHKSRTLISTYLKNGGGVLAAMGAEIDGELLAETLGGLAIRVAPVGSPAPRSIGTVDERHPVFRQLSGPSSLASVAFTQVVTLRADSCDGLARFTSGEVALLECEIGKGRALLFASDLNNQWNDFPRRATYLPFLHEAVAHLTTLRQASEYLVGNVPPGIPPVPGVIELPSSSERPGRLLAVNVDGREAEAARLSPEQFQSALVADAPAVDAPRAARTDQEERQNVWQYILAAMLVLLVAESAVAARIG